MRREGIVKARQASRRSCTAVVTALLASGCATTIVDPNLGARDTARLNSVRTGSAYVELKLDHCDDLVCYHTPEAHYYVRDVQCIESDATVPVCEYERAKTEHRFPEPSLEWRRSHGTASPGETEAPLVRTKARSRLSQTRSGSWQIVADMPAQDEVP